MVAILFGEAVFFSSLALLGYALAYCLWLTAFVALKEEPDLRRTFGRQLRLVLPRRAALGPEDLALTIPAPSLGHRERRAR